MAGLITEPRFASLPLIMNAMPAAFFVTARLIWDNGQGIKKNRRNVKDRKQARAKAQLATPY